MKKFTNLLVSASIVFGCSAHAASAPFLQDLDDFDEIIATNQAGPNLQVQPNKISWLVEDLNQAITSGNYTDDVDLIGFGQIRSFLFSFNSDSRAPSVISANQWARYFSYQSQAPPSLS